MSGRDGQRCKSEFSGTIVNPFATHSHFGGDLPRFSTSIWQELRRGREECWAELHEQEEGFELGAHESPLRHLENKCKFTVFFEWAAKSPLLFYDNYNTQGMLVIYESIPWKDTLQVREEIEKHEEEPK